MHWESFASATWHDWMMIFSNNASENGGWRSLAKPGEKTTGAGLIRMSGQAAIPSRSAMNILTLRTRQTLNVSNQLSCGCHKWSGVGCVSTDCTLELFS